MLPQFLAGSYKRYKEDTDAFTTWLHKTAVQFGYNSRDSEHTSRQQQDSKSSGGKPQSTRQKDSIKKPTTGEVIVASTKAPGGGRLKGQARIKARAAAAAQASAPNIPSITKVEDEPKLKPSIKYTITTRQVLEQAEYITHYAGPPKIEVPSKIIAVVERAIAARQRFREWYQRIEVEVNEPLDGHAHFIEVLQEALTMLKPAVSSSSKNPSGVQEPSTQDLSNRFGALKIHHTDDTLTAATISDELARSQQGTPKKPSKERDTNDIYEAIVDEMLDHAFSVFCFFEDLHQIQEYLQETWTRYKSNDLDLISATLTTNSALALVQRLEKDLLESLPTKPQSLRSYESLTLYIYAAAAIRTEAQDALTASHPDMVELLKLNDFTYLSTARILMKFEHLTSVKTAYPQPVVPVSIHFLGCPQLFEEPEVKRWIDEDKFYSQIMMDTFFAHESWKSLADRMPSKYEGSDQKKRPADDEVTRGIHSLIATGEVSVWNVFAARVLLDIREVLGSEITRPHETLKRVTSDAWQLINFEALGPGNQGTVERWQTNDVWTITTVDQWYDYWIKEGCFFSKLKPIYLQAENPFLRNRSAFKKWNPDNVTDEERAMLRERGYDIYTPLPPEIKKIIDNITLPDFIKPDPDPLFVQSHNPLLCGTYLKSVSQHMELAGVFLANHHATVFAIAHLYSALKVAKHIKGDWPDLDRAIEVNMSVIFGPKFPEKPREMRGCFAVKLGLSPRSFQTPAGSKRKRKYDFMPGRASGPILEPSIATRALRPYFDQAQPLENCLYQLAPLLQKEASQAVMTRDGTINAPRYIALMEQALPNILQTANIDYITLTRQCSQLLRDMAKEIKRQKGIDHAPPRSKQEDDSRDLRTVFMVLDIFQEVLTCEEIFESRGLNSKDITGPGFDVCGEILQRFLNKLQGVDENLLPGRDGFGRPSVLEGVKTHKAFKALARSMEESGIDFNELMDIEHSSQ